jgi:hypothetical protein
MIQAIIKCVIAKIVPMLLSAMEHISKIILVKYILTR